MDRKHDSSWRRRNKPSFGSEGFVASVVRPFLVIVNRFYRGLPPSQCSDSFKMSSWKVAFLLALVLCAAEASPRPMSETLLRAYANSRGTSPGAKKLLNIPEEGGEFS